MPFNQKKFNQFVLDNDIIGFFKEPIILKSGRESNWYVNWRNVSSDVFLTDQAAKFLIEFTKDLGLKPDCFYGVPEGATKLANRTQFLLAESSPHYGLGSHILPMGRGKPKEHGDPKDKYFLAMPQGSTIIVEDVTTTGESLEKTIDQLQEAQVSIVCAIGLTNRMELNEQGISVRDAILRKGVRYEEMSIGTHLLSLAYQKLNPGVEIGKAIEQEFQQYGVRSLNLV